MDDELPTGARLLDNSPAVSSFVHPSSLIIDHFPWSQADAIMPDRDGLTHVALDFKRKETRL
jgi:hypothetical protein